MSPEARELIEDSLVFSLVPLRDYKTVLTRK